MKGVLTRRFLVGLAAAGALGGGALIASTRVAQAATSRDYDDGQTYMIQWNMRRLGGGAGIACAGVCRVATADQTHGYPCQIGVAPTATPAACLTALAAACNTNCAVAPP